MISWHRLLGLILTDFFTGSNYEVELEKSLTLQEQYLDVLIIKKIKGKEPAYFPNGLETLSKHNLLTYKSLHEPLDAWAIDELVGYYTIYRKMVSPSTKMLLPIEDFQLYAVTTRRPQKLRRGHQLKRLKKGVYELWSASRPIRIIVTSELPAQGQNALWLFFSGQAEGFQFSDKHYRWHYPKNKGLLWQLYERYLKEEVVMSYTWEEFHREYTDPYLKSLSPEVLLKELSPEERLEGLSPNARLKGLSPDVRLKGLSPDVVFKQYQPEERLKGLSPEVVFKQYQPEERLEGLSPDVRLEGLSLEVIEKYLSQLKKNQ
jgi:hypothetical protein